MIKLDPEEEQDDDEHPAAKTPQKMQMPPPNTSQAMVNDVTMNHHTNNVQINLSRVTIPSPQNFVSFIEFENENLFAKTISITRRKQSTLIPFRSHPRSPSRPKRHPRSRQQLQRRRRNVENCRARKKTKATSKTMTITKIVAQRRRLSSS